MSWSQLLQGVDLALIAVISGNNAVSFLVYLSSFRLYGLPFRIMRPGIVHSVTTLQDCIALGGHFFSAPTIKYSVYGIFHTFVGSRSITNVPMDDEQEMLLRILLFWYQSMCGESSDYLKRIGRIGQGRSIQAL